MTTPYTPVATKHSTITTIVDSDEPSGVLFSTPLAELADNQAVHEVAACYAWSSGTSTAGTALQLTTTLFASTGFLLDTTNDCVTVPAPGTYEVSWACSLKSSDTTANLDFITQLVQSSAGSGFNVVTFAETTRFSATATHYVHLSGRAIVTVTIAPGTNDGGTDDDGTFKVLAFATGTVTPAAYTLTIRRIK